MSGAITNFDHDKNCPICSMGIDHPALDKVILPIIDNGLEFGLKHSEIIENVINAIRVEVLGTSIEERTQFTEYELSLLAGGYTIGYMLNQVPRIQKEKQMAAALKNMIGVGGEVKVVGSIDQLPKEIQEFLTQIIRRARNNG